MYKQLTPEQRYTISVLLQRKCSLSFIAGTIDVSVSTVCRERKRNSKADGVYDARLTALRTKRRKARTPGNRSIAPYVHSRVLELIRREQWPTEQVSGWLKGEEGLAVSTSTIYNWIAAGSPHYKDSIRKYLRYGGKRGVARPGERSPRIPAVYPLMLGLPTRTGRPRGTGRWTPLSGKMEREP